MICFIYFFQLFKTDKKAFLVRSILGQRLFYGPIRHLFSQFKMRSWKKYISIKNLNKYYISFQYSNFVIIKFGRFGWWTDEVTNWKYILRLPNLFRKQNRHCIAPGISSHLELWGIKILQGFQFHILSSLLVFVFEAVFGHQFLTCLIIIGNQNRVLEPSKKSLND